MVGPDDHRPPEAAPRRSRPPGDLQRVQLREAVRHARRAGRRDRSHLPLRRARLPRAQGRDRRADRRVPAPVPRAARGRRSPTAGSWSACSTAAPTARERSRCRTWKRQRKRWDCDHDQPLRTLDLDVFEGPFDLLITLILNEEIDLLEVHLADVVLAYIERLEARGELDLEAATEFLILIAALLELKSRLMLPGRGARGPRSRAAGGGRGAARAAARVPPLPGHRRLAARAARGGAALPLPRGAAAARAAPGRRSSPPAPSTSRRGSWTRCGRCC